MLTARTRSCAEQMFRGRGYDLGSSWTVLLTRGMSSWSEDCLYHRRVEDIIMTASSSKHWRYPVAVD